MRRVLSMLTSALSVSYPLPVSLRTRSRPALSPPFPLARSHAIFARGVGRLGQEFEVVHCMSGGFLNLALVLSAKIPIKFKVGAYLCAVRWCQCGLLQECRRRREKMSSRSTELKGREGQG